VSADGPLLRPGGVEQHEENQAMDSTADVKGGVVAYLQVDGATKAAEFYSRAFGAQVVAAHPVDDKGRTMYVHLHINGSSVMLCDSYPEFGHPPEKPQAFNLTLMVDDIDAWWRRAIDAGAEIVMPVEQMFWGAYGQLRDPFGVVWAMNQPTQS
jgi:PhnB protein